MLVLGCGPVEPREVVATARWARIYRASGENPLAPSGQDLFQGDPAVEPPVGSADLGPEFLAELADDPADALR